MGFDNGTVGFRIFHLPEKLPTDAVERFAANVAPPLEYVKEEPQWGWVTGRHLLDTEISEETAYCGGYLHFTLRQAVRKIPTALLQAECRMVELSRLAERNGERLSRKEKREIKQEVTDRLLPQMPPQISGISVVIDDSKQIMYAGAMSDKQLDQLELTLSNTIGFAGEPLTPTACVPFLTGRDSMDVPQLAFSPVHEDVSEELTTGRDFLTWLWYFQENNEGTLPKTQLGTFQFMLDGPLTFVAEGQGALESTVKKGLPTNSAEAKAALTVCKRLKQAKLSFTRERTEIWEFTFDADTFAFKSMKLPDGEAMEQAEIFEERMEYIYVIQKLLMELYKHFIETLCDDAKHSELEQKTKSWVESMNGC
jgi:phenylpyruvate tautomerase PptA (4-oxalocrotonate tautomerase family)